MLCVVDTKYKVPQYASPDDIAQVVTYAEFMGCKKAFLIYPSQLQSLLDVEIGSIRVCSATFDLSGNLYAAAGRALIESLELLF